MLEGPLFRFHDNRRKGTPLSMQVVLNKSFRFARFLCLQCLRWWHWIWPGLFDVGTFVCGLRQEEQDFLHCVVLPTGRHCSGGTLQHRDLDLFFVEKKSNN